MSVRTLIAASLMLATAAEAQNSRFTYQVPAHPQPIPMRAHGPMAGVPQPVQALPSSPIFPMSNPIAPMSNPIAPMTNPILPIVMPPTPFIRYGGIPAVVFPEPSENAGTRREPPYGGRDRHARGGIAPIGNSLTPGGTFRTPANVTPSPTGSVTGNRTGATTETPTAAIDPPLSTPGEPAGRQPAEDGAPLPRRRPSPPSLGTSRAEVLGHLGNPWGTFAMNGSETFYFDGGLVVVLTGGRVSQVR